MISRLTNGRWTLAAVSVLVMAASRGAALAQEEAVAPAEQAVASVQASAAPAAVFDVATSLDDLRLHLLPLPAVELEPIAGRWFEMVRASTERTVEAQLAIPDGSGAAADAARDTLVGLRAARRAGFDRFLTVLDSWEAKGGDADAIAQYRAYRTAVAVQDSRATDLRTLRRVVGQWAESEEGGIGLLRSTAVVVAALVVLVMVARVARRLTRRAAGRVQHLSKLLEAFVATAAYWIVLTIGLMLVLSALGVNITPLFAVVGGASFIMAFAFQSTLSNLAAGLMIMLNRPFDEGDYVKVGGVAGSVQAVNIVSTRIVTPDNQIIVVPNANVWGDVITNVTTSPTRRVDLTFSIDYKDSIEVAQRVLEEVVGRHPAVLADPAPVIRVAELADSSVNFIVRPWVKGADYWTVFWDLTRQVKEAFDAHGISIPFPQRDVHVRGGGQITAGPQKVPDAATADRRTE